MNCKTKTLLHAARTLYAYTILIIHVSLPIKILRIDRAQLNDIERQLNVTVGSLSVDCVCVAGVLHVHVQRVWVCGAVWNIHHVREHTGLYLESLIAMNNKRSRTLKRAARVHLLLPQPCLLLMGRKSFRHIAPFETLTVEIVFAKHNMERRVIQHLTIWRDWLFRSPNRARRWHSNV